MDERELSRAVALLTLQPIAARLTEEADERSRRKAEAREEAERSAVRRRELEGRLESLPAIARPTAPTDNGTASEGLGLGCGIWVVATFVLVLLAAIGAVSENFLGGNPFVLLPFAWLAGFVLLPAVRDRRRQRYEEALSRSEERAAERERLRAQIDAEAARS